MKDLSSNHTADYISLNTGNRTQIVMCSTNHYSTSGWSHQELVGRQLREAGLTAPAKTLYPSDSFVFTLKRITSAERVKGKRGYVKWWWWNYGIHAIANPGDVAIVGTVSRPSTVVSFFTLAGGGSFVWNRASCHAVCVCACTCDVWKCVYVPYVYVCVCVCVCMHIWCVKLCVWAICVYVSLCVCGCACKSDVYVLCMCVCGCACICACIHMCACVCVCVCVCVCTRMCTCMWCVRVYVLYHVSVTVCVYMHACAQVHILCTLLCTCRTLSECIGSGHHCAAQCNCAHADMVISSTSCTSIPKTIQIHFMQVYLRENSQTHSFQPSLYVLIPMTGSNPRLPLMNSLLGI